MKKTPLSDVVNVCILYVGEIGVTECEDDYVFKTAREYVWPSQLHRPSKIPRSYRV